MKRTLPWFILLALVGALALPAIAKENGLPKYKVVEVKHFTKAESVSLSDEYMKMAYEDFLMELPKENLFAAVVGDGATLSAADAVDAIVLNCKITEYKTGMLMPPYIIVDVTLTNRSDGKTIRQFSSRKIPLNNGGHVPNDEIKARNTGRFLAGEIKHELK